MTSFDGQKRHGKKGLAAMAAENMTVMGGPTLSEADKRVQLLC